MILVAKHFLFVPLDTQVDRFQLASQSWGTDAELFRRIRNADFSIICDPTLVKIVGVRPGELRLKFGVVSHFNFGLHPTVPPLSTRRSRPAILRGIRAAVLPPDGISPQ